MAFATDQSTISVVIFFAGMMVAYAFLKRRATTLKAIYEERLKNEIELAKREASLETSELQVKVEASQREAGRLLALAQTEAEAVTALKIANEKEREFLQKEILRLSGLKPDEAKRLAFESLQKKYESEARRLREENLDRPEQETEEEARRILISAMQRLTTTTTQDATAVSVSIPSEDMKGRLIGREGRNIRTFEQSTGATLLIDETPGMVLISCFDHVRREVARLALERMVKDGRINPTLI